MRDWERRLIFVEAHWHEALSIFDIETKAVLIGHRRCSKELFRSNLILEEDCKELLYLLAISKKKIGCGLIMKCL